MACQNQNQQNNQQNTPLNHSVNPNPSNPSHAPPPSNSATGGVENRPFSYGGSNSFQFKGHSQNEGEEANRPDFPISAPDYDPATQPKATADKNSVPADFKSDTTTENSPSAYKSPLTGSSSQRGLSAYSPSTAGDTAPALKDKIKSTAEKMGEKINKGVRKLLRSGESYGAVDNTSPPQSATAQFLDWFKNKKDQAKKKLLKTYDKKVGISREEFQQRLQLNDESVDLYKLQEELFLEACQIHNCDKTGASPEMQSQIKHQLLRQPRSQ